MTRPAHLFKTDEIGLRKIYYERRSSDDVWGDLASDEAVEFYFEQGFHQSLTLVIRDIENYIGGRTARKVEGIISAGAYVDKPGMHKLGRAFDLDGIVWKSMAGAMDVRPWKATEFGGSGTIEMYLRIQAICMIYFGTVLGYQYNKAHEDHIHMDDERNPGFRHNSRSIVLFIQDALGSIFDRPVARDGSWGPVTWNAMRFVLGLNWAEEVRYPTDEQYFIFLELCAEGGGPSNEEIQREIDELETSIRILRGKLRR